MSNQYTIRLNIWPLALSLPSFRLYRKTRGHLEAKPRPSVFGFSLPVNRNTDEWSKFWIQFSEAEGFEEFHVSSMENINLTQRALFYGICESARQRLPGDRFEIPQEEFFEEIRFNFQEYDEGFEQLIVQPFYVREKRLFGWLSDFHFRAREGTTSSRRVQQLSLSLDKNFKRNLDSYSDRIRKIEEFTKALSHVFSAVTLPGNPQPLETTFTFLDFQAKRLMPKIYVFEKDRESRSQFRGLLQNGPLERLERPPRLLFAFREQDRQAARTLAMALRGTKKGESYNFPGFESLFKSSVTIDPNPVILPDLTLESFKNALQRVEEDHKTATSTIPIFILPEGDDNGYMHHKALFAHEGIPTQVCTTKIIEDAYTLKWSIANIALQIFCKSGGKPWKVLPTAKRTLIIGISQSHKVRKEGNKTEVDKYFAFCVMSDNSGLFQELRILGTDTNKENYLNKLRSNLYEILIERSSAFSQVVIHTSFRLKYAEIDAIRGTVERAIEKTETKCDFAVIKINHNNRFFGIYPNTNSLVPFEGTTVRLGGGEYLMWLEGIFPDHQTVTKAYRGPTLLTFLRLEGDNPVRDMLLLQDVLNLSGANWRGFNAKSAPVSVFYCHLVADLVHEFHLRNLPLPTISDLRPWFL